MFFCKCQLYLYQASNISNYMYYLPKKSPYSLPLEWLCDKSIKCTMGTIWILHDVHITAFHPIPEAQLHIYYVYIILLLIFPLRYQDLTALLRPKGMKRNIYFSFFLTPFEPWLALFLLLLNLPHLPAWSTATTREHPCEAGVVKAGQTGGDGQPVQETEIPADNQHHLKHQGKAKKILV